MSDTLVRVENISKKFCRSLRRSLWYGLQDLGNELRGRSHSEQDRLRKDEFWAVRDVSFELERGECLGLVGHNGAGKTTLLRMLNGLIKPDSGRIELRGRVAALIALGAGFHPLLTGRENVYISGSVLGMTRSDITRILPDIVEFSGLGDFIDSPVQSYSSGMHVRLGFAIASANTPDVLLLDEVLAVGDAGFRARCYKRLAELRDQAAFILVSHSADQISQVCSQALLLASGTAIFHGSVEEALTRYLDCSRPAALDRGIEHVASDTQIDIHLTTQELRVGESMRIAFSITPSREIRTADIRIVIWDSNGLAIADSYTKNIGTALHLTPGQSVYQCCVGPLFLKAGHYAVSVAIIDRALNDHIYWGDRAFRFEMRGLVGAMAPHSPPIKVARA